jgi:hypothetical protein
MPILGGSTFTFLEHLSTEYLVEDLLQLYTRLVDLGMSYREGQIHLVDLDEVNRYLPP